MNRVDEAHVILSFGRKIRTLPVRGFRSFGLLLALWLCLPAVIWGEETPLERPLFQGYVSMAAELPPEMYGHWQRTRFLVTSNFPTAFEPMESGYWEIGRSGDHLTLTNPERGTSATLQVQEVVGNTARFEYRSTLANGVPCVEELTLTASESGLLGFQKKECSPNSTTHYSALAKVQAIRVEGTYPTVW